ncbi:hypothetical protein KIL84_001055 [Mauremys mutica]|uniref:Uncharacterized protein n=1 Tax=Mauremys mutica TaxID=74926 RepID=A0A9D4AVI0_9SAUR|nr:hypothetical protein KIL84_001055 [Mauremys mutica]
MGTEVGKEDRESADGDIRETPEGVDQQSYEGVQWQIIRTNRRHLQDSRHTIESKPTEIITEQKQPSGCQLQRVCWTQKQEDRDRSRPLWSSIEQTKVSQRLCNQLSQ